MKKLSNFLTLAILLGSSLIFAQSHDHEGHYHQKTITSSNFCGTYDQIDKLYEQNPGLKEQTEIEEAEFQSFYEDYLNTWSNGDRSTYIIPVVVHIVHLNGPENISNTQVYDAINRLNEDFNMNNSDISNVVATFVPLIGDGSVEFRLASKAPDGSCHSGITRTFSNTTYDTGISGSGVHPIVEAVKSQHGTWQSRRYLNVFVCIEPAGGAAYTYKPAGYMGTGTTMNYGVIIRHDYMGSIGTASMTSRHTLAHEVGHWFNLDHLWGGSNNPGLASNCSSDDGVADTPNTQGWTSCNLSGTTCDASLDNVQNFMEYSYCSNMFTQGQVAKMHAALNSSTAGRNNLWTAGNLSFTGTASTPITLCQADFSASQTIVCGGSTVNFSDMSFHGITGRNWTFTGGSPASSTDSAVAITYNTPGLYPVSLQVTDGSTSQTKTETNYIRVLPNPGAPLPYTEGFETITFPDQVTFTVDNPDQGQTWQITSTAASLGTKSVMINNYNISTGDKDAFISGPIDLSNVPSTSTLVISFDYAYQKRSSTNAEKLKFYVSNDCGETWSLRKTIQGNALGSQISSTAFTATSEDWKSTEITNVNSTFYVSNFRYKIEFENDNGNNIFVDNINIYPQEWLSTGEIEFGNTISIYPNPTNNFTTLEFYSNTEKEVQIELYNLLGEKVQDVYNGYSQIGKNTHQISLDNLPNGVYILKIGDSENIKTFKITKN